VARLFGTDGIRGLANGDLTPQLALSLAQAAAGVLADHRAGAGRSLAVVGRDGRASGEMLEAAIVAGLASAGVDVLRVGVLPTPAISYLTAELGADLGVVLSASHNPMPDNGVKVTSSPTRSRRRSRHACSRSGNARSDPKSGGSATCPKPP
jgi:phosphoglucosamine mutase